MTESRIFNYSINDGFLWSEVDLKGEKHYYIEGYASTIDKDKSGEVIDYSAQEDIYRQIQNENITLDIEHEEWYDKDGKILPRPKNEKIPVAKIVHAEMREKGVWVKAELNTNLKSFNEIWGSIKDGFLKAFSIAFYPIKKVNNIIKSLNLVNITLTGSPVNPNATFIATMKSASAYLSSIESSSITSHPQNDLLENNIKNFKEENKMENESIVTPEVKADTQVTEMPVTVDVKAEISELEKQKIAFDAEIKALREKLESSIQAQKDEIAKLKAELAQPVMKAIVDKDLPKIQNEIKYISPLNLVR